MNTLHQRASSATRQNHPPTTVNGRLLERVQTLENHVQRATYYQPVIDREIRRFDPKGEAFIQDHHEIDGVKDLEKDVCERSKVLGIECESVVKLAATFREESKAKQQELMKEIMMVEPREEREDVQLQMTQLEYSVERQNQDFLSQLESLEEYYCQQLQEEWGLQLKAVKEEIQI